MIEIPVINGGEIALDNILNRNDHPNNQAMIQQLHNDFTTQVSGINSEFVNNYNNLVQTYRGDQVLNYGKSILAGVMDIVNENSIFVINQDNLHLTNNVMSNWIMANPMVQELYQNNMCDGFSETYVDIEPGVDSIDRGDYKVVMDGVGNHSNNYDIEFYTDSRYDELSAEDQGIILETFDNINKMIIEGVDPTNIDGGIL